MRRKLMHRLTGLESQTDLATRKGQECSEQSIESFIIDLRRFITELWPISSGSLSVCLLGTHMDQLARDWIPRLEERDRLLLDDFAKIKDDWHNFQKTLFQDITKHYLLHVEMQVAYAGNDVGELNSGKASLSIAYYEDESDPILGIRIQPKVNDLVEVEGCRLEPPFAAFIAIRESESAAVNRVLQELIRPTDGIPNGQEALIKSLLD